MTKRNVAIAAVLAFLLTSIVACAPGEQGPQPTHPPYAAPKIDRSVPPPDRSRFHDYGDQPSRSRGPVQRDLRVRSSHNICDINPANNFQAIEDAIAACPDGASPTDRTVIRFPVNANYTIAERIDVLHHTAPAGSRGRRNLIIDGRGTRMTATFAEGNTFHANLMLYKPRDVTIRNFNMVGSFYPEDNFDPATRRIVDVLICETQAGVSSYGGINVTMEDSTSYRACGDGFGAHFSDPYAQTILLASSADEPTEVPTNFTFQRLSSKTPARMCWGPTSADGLSMVDSYCEDGWYGGIDIEKDADHPVRNVDIARNTFNGVGRYGVLIPRGKEGPNGANTNIEIHHNEFLTPVDAPWGPGTQYPEGYGCNAPIQIGLDNYDPAFRHGPNINIYSNTIWTYGNAVRLVFTDGASITNNTFKRPPTPQGQSRFHFCGWTEAEDPIWNTQSTNITTSGNILQNNEPYTPPTTRDFEGGGGDTTTTRKDFIGEVPIKYEPAYAVSL